MHITHLIEADAYRYQPDWQGKTEPVIRMKGRVSRESSSSVYDVYGLAFGMELNGVDCPRRWKSTFATTNPGQSHFMSTASEVAGIRKLVIPKGVKIGAVSDDFNMHNSFTSVLHHIAFSIKDIAADMQTKGEQSPDNTQFKELETHARRWISDYVGLFMEPGSDAGYDWFKELVEEYDKIIMQDIVSSSLVPDNILGFGSLQAALRDQVENAIDVHKIMVFNSIDDVPTGNGMEVWFEGDYEAVPTTDEEIATFSKALS